MSDRFRRGQLWAFSGMDAAGKSTQIEMLLSALEARGARARRVWARGGYTPGFSLLKRWARASRAPVIPRSAGRSVERQQAFRNSAVRRVWLLMAIFDMALYYGVWIRWLRLRGLHVIADRYLVDTAIDFALAFPDERAVESRAWRMLARVAPRPARHFVMIVPVEESLRRSVLKGEPFPDDEATLTARLSRYQAMMDDEGMTRLDGLRPPVELHRTVVAECGLDPA